MTKWQHTTIGRLIDAGAAHVQTGPFGTQLRASDYVADGRPVINVRNIGFGQLKPEKLEYVSEATAKRLKSHLLEPFDLVFARKGAVDRHLIVRERLNGWMQGSDCIRVRLDPNKAHPPFVSYALLRSEYKQWIVQQCSHGSTMATLNQGVISRIAFPTPPLETQRRIASILGAYDELIEVNWRRIDLLEEMARRLFDEWFVHFRFPGADPSYSTELPIGWSRGPIKSIYQGLFDGPHATPKPSREGAVFLGIGNITESGRLDLSSVKHISEEDLPRWTKRVTPRGGDLVFTYEATLNRYAIIPKSFRGSLGRRLALIRLTPGSKYRYYLFLLFFSKEWRSVVSRNTLSGATVERIPLTNFPEFPIIIPPEHVVETFDRVVGPLMDQISGLLHSNSNLSAQRDLLLPGLISGDLSVTAAERRLEDAA